MDISSNFRFSIPNESLCVAWPTADLAPERLAAVSGVVAGRPDFSDPAVVQILAGVICLLLSCY